MDELSELLKEDSNKHLGVAIALEVRRLTKKYHKDCFDCEDLMQITGLGRNNVRKLMCSSDLPVIKQGNRKFVSALGFVVWSVQNLINTCEY